MNAKYNPHSILGIQPGASPEEIRQAYLRCVRENPPDRDPERFRAIHDAYQLLSDPMVQAAAWTERTVPHNLNTLIEDAERVRPRLPRLVLLALGNQE